MRLLLPMCFQTLFSPQVCFELLPPYSASKKYHTIASWKGQCLNWVWKGRVYLAFKYTFLQLSASSVVPLSWPTPLPLKTQFPQGTQPKQTPQRKSPSPSSVSGKKGMEVRSRPCETCELVGCAGRVLWLRGHAMSMMGQWVKPVRLLSCEVSVIFSQRVPCGVWECLFSDSIMSSAHSLPGAANLRVEIVPDRQTSFVRKTTATSAITESDYTGTAAPGIPLALNRAGDKSVDSQSKVEGAKTKHNV